MILVTGAGGKTGRAIIRALVARGAAVRALVRRDAQIEAALGLGAREAVAGDLLDGAAVRGALRGIQTVYHICPNVSRDEVAIGANAVAAAQAAGVAHFVYHSVLHPQTEAMPHHWQKLRVEEALFESGLPFTILQPAAYMQNLLASWESITERGVYAVPYPADTRLSLVDLPDLAEAAARVLTEPGHIGATYEVVGTGPLSQSAVAAALGRQLGREVRIEVVDHAAWEQRARSAGLNDYAVTTLLAMFRYYERYGLWASPNVLQWLLGRPPGTLEGFIERTLAERPMVIKAHTS